MNCELENDRAFERNFEELTSFRPLSWQARLFHENFIRGNLPSSIDIPTGLGKTAVMALWLIARANGAALPRRLIYVVDRRAVVDQATEFAARLRQRLDGYAVHLKTGLHLENRSLPISTLRGQFADNREWLEDPAATSIVVGTVDMIGSRLLFEGYGVSPKMRPYHAGLLGADALVVLDESHLIPPFEKLLETIEGGVREFGALHDSNRRVIPAFKLLSLSATGGDRAGTVFRLKGSRDRPAGHREDLDDEIVERRLKAEKLITLVQKDSEKLEEMLARHAWSLAREGSEPIRCLVFCTSRGIAEKAKKQIEVLAAGDRKRGIDSKEVDRELFVGSRRVRERQIVSAEWLSAKGFLGESTVRMSKPAFLFATSAGEVGVDIDADHIVCDLVAWERLVQRFGRVNRRGGRSARIVIIDEGLPQPKKKDKPTAGEAAAAMRYEAVKRLLEQLPQGQANAKLASPEALRSLKDKASADQKLAATFKAATTAAPLRPALTRATVDAWSMTSLEQHTGRPEVGPWLRGWVDEQPQTTVIWRRHLPMRNGAPSTKAEIESFFEAAPPHVTEQLQSDTFVVGEWLSDRCQGLLRAVASRPDSEREDKAALDAAEGENTSVLTGKVQLSPGDVVAFVLSPAGDLLDAFLLGDFSISKEDKPRLRKLQKRLAQLTGCTLVVDARLGGIDCGLLNSSSAEIAETADASDSWISLDGGQSDPREPVVKFRVCVTATREAIADALWQERYRLPIELDADEDVVRYLVVEKWHGDSSNEEDRSSSVNPQLLSEHQSLAEDKAMSLGEKLGLPSDIARALALAARLHDEGKKSSRWQRAFAAPTGNGPYAKTKGPISFALLDGYRHEFGSLAWVDQDARFKSLESETLKDLVLHLVAAHHGQARPAINTRSCEDAPSSVLQDRARKVALRFAKLQKQWGPWGLAWLEALLRAADQQASRDNDNRTVEKPHG